MLAFARLHTPQQRRHDRIRRVQAGRQVRHSNANLNRWPISRSSDVHESHLGLDHDIVSSALAVRSRLAISSDAGVDQLGVDLAESLVVKFVFLQGTRDIVLDKDVALSDQFVEDFDAFVRCKGQGEGFLVSVDLKILVKDTPIGFVPA